MKILWFSNIEITQNISSTGTWLFTMANALIDSKKIELINITEGNVSKIQYRNSNNIEQWIIPKVKLKNGLPENYIIKEIVELVKEIAPDVIHIWGTENYWGLLYSRGFIKGNILIDIQGLKFIWYKYFFSGLSYLDLLNCITFKDLLKPKFSILGRAHSFKIWGKYEIEIIKCIPNIGVQSNWVRAQISNINSDATLYTSKIRLRNPFLTQKKWDKNNSEHFRIFTSTSAVLSYKGLHILIEAINILKRKYLGIKLVIAGYITPVGIRQNGYDKFLMQKIKKYNLSENIIWRGSLDAELIASELLKSNLCIIPSFIESYCVALDEALTLGVPTVVSFTGAMPELATHEFSALFYSSIDIIDCAYQIERLFDLSFAEKISNNAYEVKRNSLKNFNNSEEQLNVYQTIISKKYIG